MSECSQIFLGTTTCGTNSLLTPLKLSYDAAHVVNLDVSSAGNLSFNLLPGGVTSFICPFINQSTTTPQMTLRYDSTHTSAFNCDIDGNVVIQATGTYVDFNSANQVRILNTTESTSKTSGCLVLSGGLGVATFMFCSKLFLESDTPPQLIIKYGNSPIYNYIGTLNTGDLRIESSGTTTVFDSKLYVDAATASYRVYGRKFRTYDAWVEGPWVDFQPITIVLEKWGYVVFMRITTSFWRVWSQSSPIFFVSDAYYLTYEYLPAEDTKLLTIVRTSTTAMNQALFRVLTTGECFWYANVAGANFTGGYPGLHLNTYTWISNNSL